MSFIQNLYRGKGDALNRGNYRCLTLTEHAIKVMERIADGMIREMIVIDEMQFAFVPGRGTTDAIFIIRQLQEKFLSRKDLNDSLFCFCWSGESVWPCPPKGLVVGYEKVGGRRVDSSTSNASTTMHAAVISWSLLLLLKNVLNVSRRGRRDWNPRVFMWTWRKQSSWLLGSGWISCRIPASSHVLCAVRE